MKKQVQFYGRMLLSRPAELPALIVRRAIEAISEPPAGIARTMFDQVNFDVDTSLHILTRKYFFHTHEMFLERIFRTYLGSGDIFIDVGANLGYWSAFASSLVGRTGEVHAFEPVPHFFSSVARLASANPDYNIYANNTALGARDGVATMQVVEPTPENYSNFSVNIGSSSLVSGFLDGGSSLTKSVDVPITTFDGYSEERGIDLRRIGLIKIDVEGYEGECLDGMQSVLALPGRKIPLLIEVLTDPNRLEMLDGRRIVRRLEAHGYRCLDALSLKPVEPRDMGYEENLICVSEE